MIIAIIFMATLVVRVFSESSLSSIDKTFEVDSEKSVENRQTSFAPGSVTSSLPTTAIPTISGEDAYKLWIARMNEEIESSNVTGTGWIEQKLDHFSNSDKRTWKMRYMYNGEFYRNNSVLFFWSSSYYIDYLLLKSGPIIDQAKEMGAYLFLLEGRFFGKSLPTGDLSIESLQYASTDQLLEDLKISIETIIKKFSLQNDTITLFGIHESAAIAAWFRLIYPGLVHHVDAHGPPVLAKSYYPEYYEFLGKILRNVGGDICYNNVSKIFDDYHTLIIDRNATELKQLLNICDNFDLSNGYDVYSLFSQVASKFYTYHWQKKMCKSIGTTNNPDKLVSAFSRFVVRENNRRNRSQNCTDYTYAKKYGQMRNNTSVKMISRITFYRKCTEYGRFPVFDSLEQPFGKRSITITPNHCEYVFGKNFTLERIANGVKRTNKKFGGNRRISSVTYSFFGDLDLKEYLFSISDAQM